MDARDPFGVDRAEQVQVPAAFFRWLRDDEQAIDRNPMEHLHQDPADGGGGVKRFGGRAEHDARLVEVVVQGGEVA